MTDDSPMDNGAKKRGLKLPTDHLLLKTRTSPRWRLLFAVVVVTSILGLLTWYFVAH